MTTPLSKPLHLSIACGNRGPSFEPALQMVKVGLLYADRATIYSPDMVLTLFGLGGFLTEESATVWEMMTPDESSKQLVREWWIQPLDELLKAKQSGWLEVGCVDVLYAYAEAVRDLPDPLGPTFDATGRVTDIESFREHVERGQRLVEKAERDVIVNTLADGSTYPFFDSVIGDVAARVLASPEPRLGPARKAREIRLAADLTSRLPSFEKATVDELLDIRRELQRPLVGFRSQVIKLAEQISVEPWGEDFQNEAETLMRREIEPAILHLEDAVQSNRLLTKLAYESPQIPLEVGRDTIFGFALGSLGGAATSLLGAATGAGVAAVKVYREWKEKKGEIERNQLYFYYEAGRRLRRPKRKRLRVWRGAR